MLEKSKKRHLKWKVENNFFWIELHIDKSLYESEDKGWHQIDDINEEDSEASGNNFLRRK